VSSRLLLCSTLTLLSSAPHTSPRGCAAGVVPACAALDCLTVFARSVSEGVTVMQVMEGGDAGPADVWRRNRLTLAGLPQQGFRFAVPSEQFTEWDGPGEG
jgi:allophanate hydrolase